MSRRRRQEYYLYTVDGMEHAFENVLSEAKLLIHMGNRASWVVFRPHREDVVVRGSRLELLDAVMRLSGALEEKGERLEYRYRVKAVGLPDGPSSSSGGLGFACKFGGEVATVDAGAGYCQIVAIRPLSPQPQRLLADMTDMQERVADNGVRFVPSRKREPMDLLEKIRRLERFLKERSGEIVEQRVERR